MCVVNRELTGDSLGDLDAWKKLRRKQFETLTTKPIEIDVRYLKTMITNNDTRSRYISLFEKYESNLADIENRYPNFLNADIRSTLMDIQDSLYDLRYSLSLWLSIEEYSEHSIESLIARSQKGSDKGLLAIKKSVENILTKINNVVSIIDIHY